MSENDDKDLELVPPRHLFVAVIGDLEHTGGLLLRIAGKNVRAEFVRHARSASGRPIALYKVPGFRKCFAVTMDVYTRQLYVLQMMECGGHVIPIRPEAA